MRSDREASMATPRRRERTETGGIADGFVARRHQLGLTQAELADLAGVSRSSVQSIESGRGTVQLDLVEAAADALGCRLVLVTRAGVEVTS
nr:helix-turn-helix domain-containing protein [Rhodococcus jostii]